MINQHEDKIRESEIISLQDLLKIKTNKIKDIKKITLTPEQRVLLNKYCFFNHLDRYQITGVLVNIKV